MNQFISTCVLMFIGFLQLSPAQICVELITPNPAVLQGETFQVKILVHGIPENAKLFTYVNESPLKVSADSSVYRTVGGSPGEYKARIQIIVKSDTGILFKENRDLNYIVFPPIAMIQGVEGNILYQGIANPLSIYVAGVNYANVIVSADEGTLSSNGPGKYFLTFDNPCNKAIVSVAVKISDRLISMGRKAFRVVPIPTPVISLPKHQDSLGNAGYSYIIPEFTRTLGDFEWKISYWEMSIFHEGEWQNFTGNSPQLGLPASQALNNTLPGDKVIVENVKIEITIGDRIIQTLASTGFTVK